MSRICHELDTDVAAFRDRTLTEVAFPTVFLDATYCRARVGGDPKAGAGCRVVSQAIVVAIGLSADGREVLGVPRRRQ